MGRQRDKFWKYVDSENECIFCEQKISGASRIKYHLAQVPGGGISKCRGVPDDVKGEAEWEINNSNLASGSTKGKYVIGRKRYEFWEYVDSENKCIFCGEKIPGACRVKFHLAQIPGGGTGKCNEVPDEVKAAAELALNNSNKRVKQSTTPNDLEENNINSNLGSSSTRGEIEVDLLPTTDLVEFKYYNEIWEWLMRDEVDVSIMGVWGMGGVGKTALLKNVHNELLKLNRHAIWICVSKYYDIQSQYYDIHRLQRVIAKSIDESIWDEDDDDVKTAARLLHAFRKMNECVVFLDDVWHDISLEDVGIPLRNDGIRIIVASRLLDVCKRMGCKDNIVQVETLEGYGEDFDLFSKSLGDDVTLTKDMTDIAKKLVRQCGGLPLAIIAIARSMIGKTDIREWRTTLSKLERTEMDQHDIKQCVFPVLKSSYDRLNDTTLQDCFLSLSLYFEDHHEFRREDLIRNFVDEGLTGERRGFEAQFDEAHSILNKLINNSLLVETEDNTIRLHELVRAMAINIGKESHGCVSKEELPDEREWEEDLQKVSLFNCGMAEIPSGMAPNCPKLSTLRMLYSLVEVIPDSFFTNMPALKILDLSWNSRIEVLPLSISNLECLTVLLLGSCKSLHLIPSLAKLRHLRRLDLSNTAITQVPLGFENLTNLRWLHLSRTAAMKAEHLERLPMLESIGATFVDKNEFNACIQIIEKRINSGMMRGYSLRLVGDEESVTFYDHDAYNIDGDKAIEINGVEHRKLLLPSNIDELKIMNCNQCSSLCDVLSIQQSYNALHISKCTVYRCKELEYLFCSSKHCNLCSLRDLNELELRELNSLSMLCKENEVGSFSHLTKLSIFACGGMKKLLTPRMSAQLHNLEEIRVEYCRSMEEVFSTERNTNFDDRGLWVPDFDGALWLPAERNTNEVDMDGTTVEAINLPNFDDALWLLAEIEANEVDMDETNVEAINLPNFDDALGLPAEIEANEVDMDGTNVEEINLPNLKSVSLRCLNELTSECKGIIVCSSLKEFWIVDCPKLKCVPQTQPPFEIQVLDRNCQRIQLSNAISNWNAVLQDIEHLLLSETGMCPSNTAAF